MNKALVFTLLAISAPAAAQPVEHPDQTDVIPPAPATQIQLAVEVLSHQGTIDALAVHQAIAAELGVRVSGPTSFAPALGRLDVVIDGGAVHVA